MRIAGYAVLCLAAAVSFVPKAWAVSTATVTAKIKFTLSASAGTLSAIADDGEVETYVELDGLDDSDLGLGPNSSVLSVVGGNSASASTAADTGTMVFESLSSVTLGVPSGTYAQGDAYGEGTALLNVTAFPVGLRKFDLLLSPYSASISKDLATDASGLYAYGEGEFILTLRYTATRGDGTLGHVVLQSIEIGSDDVYSDTYSETAPYTFSGIPTSATDIEIFWSTFVYADVETGAAVPDAGHTAAFLMLGVAVLGALRPRRK